MEEFLKLILLKFSDDTTHMRGILERSHHMTAEVDEIKYQLVRCISSDQRKDHRLQERTLAADDTAENRKMTVF